LNTYLSDNTQSVGKEFEFKNINFIENSSDLTTESLTSIEQIKSLLESNLRLQIKILVFDKNGDSKLNTKKAFAVKRELIKDGIESKRVDAGSGGVGPSFPKIKVISK
jgi:outer membrane protein OmpA-like peptidoglycan-associated protein